MLALSTLPASTHVSLDTLQQPQQLCRPRSPVDVPTSTLNSFRCEQAQRVLMAERLLMSVHRHSCRYCQNMLSALTKEETPPPLIISRCAGTTDPQENDLHHCCVVVKVPAAFPLCMQPSSGCKATTFCWHLPQQLILKPHTTVDFGPNVLVRVSSH